MIGSMCNWSADRLVWCLVRWVVGLLVGVRFVLDWDLYIIVIYQADSLLLNLANPDCLLLFLFFLLVMH